jgi:hypothetical protein
MDNFRLKLRRSQFAPSRFQHFRRFAIHSRSLIAET